MKIAKNEECFFELYLAFEGEKEEHSTSDCNLQSVTEW